jgi:non-ribosomal peptide synthetase component E (peptide arylation enzyme)
MEELKDIAPHLSQLPKKDAFTAPEGYFEDLPSSIQYCVIAQTKTRSRTFYPVWVFSTLGVAAVLCVLFFIGKSTEVHTSISEQEAATYINENLEQEFDETLLAEELVTSNNETSTSEVNLEEYILNQDIDEQLLREEI